MIIEREAVSPGKPPPGAVARGDQGAQRRVQPRRHGGGHLGRHTCARAAGFTAIAVSYGFSDLSVFALGADTVIDDFVELASVLRKAS